MYGLRCGPGKVDGAAPGCGGEQEPALDGGCVFGRVCAWGLESVEEDIAVVGGGGSCKLLGAGVGGGERSSAERATPQTAGARTGGSVKTEEGHDGYFTRNENFVGVDALNSASTFTLLWPLRTGQVTYWASRCECETARQYC